MAPTPKTCMVPGCDMGPEGGPYQTDSGNRSREEVKEDMNEHRKDHELALKTLELSRSAAADAGNLQGVEGNRPKPAKLERPVLEQGASEADWGMFMNRWERYKRNCKFSDQQEIIDQLWGCLADGLERAAQMDGAGDLKTETELRDRIKRLAVKQQNTLVSQVKFLQMGQDRDEPVAGFVARLRGTAQLCDLVNCSHCQRETSYQDKVMAHQLVRALVDPTIQEKILALASDGKKLSLQEIISAVEAQEMGKRSQGLLTGSGGLNRMSEYRSNKDKPKYEPSEEKCKSCGRKDHKKGADECRAKGKECNKCRKIGHFSIVCESKAKVAAVSQQEKTPRAKTESALEAGALAVRADTVDTPTGDGAFFCISEGKQRSSVTVHHHVFEEGRWAQKKVKPHPVIPGIRVEVDRQSYKSRNITEPTNARETVTEGLADTGAQMVVLGPQQLAQLGVREKELTPVMMKIITADDCTARGGGMVLVKITARDDAGKELVSRQQAYYMAGATHVFLSRECLEDLEVISPEFPKVGSCRAVAAGRAAGTAAGTGTEQHLEPHLARKELDQQSQPVAARDCRLPGTVELLSDAPPVVGAQPGATNVPVNSSVTSSLTRPSAPKVEGQQRPTEVAEPPGGLQYTPGGLVSSGGAGPTRQEGRPEGGGLLQEEMRSKTLPPGGSGPPEGGLRGQTASPVWEKVGVCTPRPGAVEGEERPCSCPERTLPPPVPKHCPFPATPENVGRIKDWIVNYYGASAFNTCTYQQLPMVTSSPPLRLLVDPDYKPVAVLRPGSVPLHLVKEVKEGLDKDERLGVIEKVPVNTPVTWCARMVVCMKKSGKVRRTVDFKPFNRAAPRQTHAVEPPFMQASKVPPRTWRTCLDAWEGYHSIPIHEEDRHITTFLTQWGRYRYLVTPQGYLSAGDGYCQRYDLITRDVKQSTRCVDDTCLWEDSVEENFFSTCQYLTLGSSNGIVFTVSKFQFCQRELEFVGFWLAEDGIRPTLGMLESITNFPRPRDISGVRSFFGLVEQVSWAFSKTDIMSPFRELLSSKSVYLWTQELQDAFEKAKEMIVESVKEGIKSFDVDRVTCLNTDWSKVGISFAIMQKYCPCSKVSLRCCRTGWKLCYANSRFCSLAESRYSPIEGEALAVAWGLERGKHFLMGARKLLVGVDHKPLVGIYSEEKSLADIENPRLRNLAEKATRYRFVCFHVPGRLNNIPDSLSRYPVGNPVLEEQGELGSQTAAAEAREQLGALWWAQEQQGAAPGWLALAGGIRESPTCAEIKEAEELEKEVEVPPAHRTAPELQGGTREAGPRLITWERLQKEALQDPGYQELVSCLDLELASWPGGLQRMGQYKDKLVSEDGVLIYEGRIVIPKVLRQEVLDTLHSGHQGTTSMAARADSSVWWPGLREELARVRERCLECQANAPSQPKEPPVAPPSPQYPFQMICGDYFTLKGREYLVLVDRYSGWPSVHHCKSGANSRHLVRVLQEHCETFGVPEELSTDRGSQFVSETTKEFMKVWGIRHRQSSAMNPHSNTRAELGVKSMKRLIRSNIGLQGALDTVKMGRALLQYRNTPDRDTGRSPAQVVFGRMVRDFLPVHRQGYRPRKEWLLLADQREEALSRRRIKKREELERGTKQLTPLTLGNVVSVQNQTGPHKLKWDKSGTVVEVLDYHQYKVKMDGSGRVSLRNRAYLRPITPYAQSRRSKMPLVRTRQPGDAVVHGPEGLEVKVRGADQEHQESLEPGPRRSPAADEVGALRQSTRIRRAPVWFVPG